MFVSSPIEIRAVGTAEASAVIQARSQVSGELVRVGFSEGADVQQGDLLFEIDPRPYEHALQLAEAALQRDTAVLNLREVVGRHAPTRTAGASATGSTLTGDVTWAISRTRLADWRFTVTRRHQVTFPPM